jgi:hypothetical protein
MSISYTGHCKLSVSDAQKRIAFARRAHPEWFHDALHLSDARAPSPSPSFGREIAREFGIDAESAFTLDVYDKFRMEPIEEAIEFVYRVFGPDDLVITWALDSIRRPRERYAPMDIGA